MSDESVEVVLGFFNAAEVAAAIDLLSEDVTFAFHGETRVLSGAGELFGKPAAINWMVDWFSRFRDYSFVIDETRDWGDRVFVATTHRAKGRTSGAPIRQQTAQVMTVRDGKIVRQDFFASPEEALEAAEPSK